MANRILIRPEGMKISMPGVDVFSAAPQQLLFDSDFGGITVGARGQYVVWGYGDHYVGLPRVFPETALIMVEAGGHMLGGCRTAGEMFDAYTFNWNISRFVVSLANSTTLMIRHTGWSGTSDGGGLLPPPAGPASFPYVVSTIYLYWVKGETQLRASTDFAVANTNNTVILATYKGSVLLFAAYGRTIIDGGQIKTQSITTAQMTVGAVTAEIISVTALSAISGNIGTIVSGMLRSYDALMQIDLNNRRILIADYT